jgi:hypothetical protein
MNDKETSSTVIIKINKNQIYNQERVSQRQVIRKKNQDTFARSFPSELSKACSNTSTLAISVSLS